MFNQSMIRRRSGLALCFVLGVGLSACATSRSVISVDVPNRGPEAAGVPAKIIEVVDSRKFSVDPHNPSLPSIGNASEITDPKLTSRAVGRKRNGFGAALGDIVLPEGQTVPGLVRSAAQQALREKGYRVVESDSPDYAAAAPLALNIEQFWTWMRPGFSELKFYFEASVTIKGSDLVPGSADVVTARAQLAAQTGMESNWKEVIQTGLDRLAPAIKDKIKPASSVRPVLGTEELSGPKSQGSLSNVTKPSAPPSTAPAPNSMSSAEPALKVPPLASLGPDPNSAALTSPNADAVRGLGAPSKDQPQPQLAGGSFVAFFLERVQSADGRCSIRVIGLIFCRDGQVAAASI